MFRRVLSRGVSNTRYFSSTPNAFGRALVYSEYGQPERVLEYVVGL